MGNSNLWTSMMSCSEIDRLRISLIVTGCFGHRDRFAAALDTG
jgi:hypothetical protein